MDRDRQLVALHVVAEMPGPISAPYGGIPLDTLLAAQVARRLGLPPCSTLADWQPIEIPVALEPDGRFHLCSEAAMDLIEKETRDNYKRSPVEEYQRSANVKGVINTTAKEDKAWKLSIDLGHLRDERLEWWCVGDQERIGDLLGDVTALGKKRSNGFGEVKRWVVEPCEPWGDGFPVARDGHALRALPTDYPGLASNHPTRFRVLGLPIGPSWAHERQELCASP